jgi:hypothetical protein
MIRAFLRLNPSPESFRGWRSVLWLCLGLLIVVLVPQVRVLLTAGFLGGVVLGGSLIIARREFSGPGPRRGTPIVLFPRPANVSAGRA